MGVCGGIGGVLVCFGGWGFSGCFFFITSFASSYYENLKLWNINQTQCWEWWEDLTLQWKEYLALSPRSKTTRSSNFMTLLHIRWVFVSLGLFLNEVTCISMLDAVMVYPWLVTVITPMMTQESNIWLDFLSKKYGRFLERTHSATAKHVSLKTSLIKGKDRSSHLLNNGMA